MEIHEYLEHTTDATVPKSGVKGQETLGQIKSAITLRPSEI